MPVYLYISGEWIPLIESPRLRSPQPEMTGWVTENAADLLEKYLCPCTICGRRARCTAVGMKNGETIIYPVCTPSGHCIGAVTLLLDQYVSSATDPTTGREVPLVHASQCMYCLRVQPTYRCSRCQLENYCGPVCQGLDWMRHQPLCDLRQPEGSHCDRRQPDVRPHER